MNFNITHNWLLEYIDTDATPQEIQEYLSLSSVNVETLEKVSTSSGDDWVYDIEVTSNRIDAASVIGFAQECVAVLPQHGKSASFKKNILEKTFEDVTRNPAPTHDSKQVEIQVKDTDTVTRVAAVVLSEIKIGQTPEYIKSRLEACGERSINNVVDITNYIRIALGQPMHAFDYDQIKNAFMSIEKSSKGDVVVLLDDTQIELPGNDVIIRDGEHRIIDLVGLMGGQNTEVTEKTQNVLLFVPIVNKTLVRKTSMSTGQRTPAISYFEKGLDEDRVEPSLVLGIELVQEIAQGKIASEIFDYYPTPYVAKTIEVNTRYTNSLMGTTLEAQHIADMIAPLGFDAKISTDDAHTLDVHVPSFRSKDVETQADIAEEIARIYGYHNIEPHIQKTEVVYQPLDVQALYNTKMAVKRYLAARGYFEQYNYSMISHEQIELLGLDVSKHLKLSNTISKDIEYMRTSLVPSLLKNLNENRGYEYDMEFFETARVYSIREGDLPQENEILGLVSEKNFFYVKGTLENVCHMLNIEAVSCETCSDIPYLNQGMQARIVAHGSNSNDEKVVIGYIGTLTDAYTEAHKLRKAPVVIEVHIDTLSTLRNPHPKYIKPNQHAHIFLDYTYTSDKEHLFSDFVRNAHAKSDFVKDISLLQTFENKVTLRITFAAEDRNITEEEAKVELQKITA